MSGKQETVGVAAIKKGEGKEVKKEGKEEGMVLPKAEHKLQEGKSKVEHKAGEHKAVEHKVVNHKVGERKIADHKPVEHKPVAEHKQVEHSHAAEHKHV
jgi:hypothetical protein